MKNFLVLIFIASVFVIHAQNASITTFPSPQPISISVNQVNQIYQRLSGDSKNNFHAIIYQLEKSHSIYPSPKPKPQLFPISDNQVNQINQWLSVNSKINFPVIINQLEKSHSIFPQPIFINHLPGMFCKWEHKMDSKSKLAPRFRLGSLNYTNWMEGKGELYSRYWN